MWEILKANECKLCNNDTAYETKTWIPYVQKWSWIRLFFYYEYSKTSQFTVCSIQDGHLAQCCWNRTMLESPIVWARTCMYNVSFAACGRHLLLLPLFYFLLWSLTCKPWVDWVTSLHDCTNVGVSLTGSSGIKFSEVWMKIWWFSFNKMHLNMSSIKTGILFKASLGERTFYYKISWSLEVARFEVIMIVSFWNLTVISAALLPSCLSNLDLK